MILAIDVGNTNIVMGCIENGQILNIVRIQTNDRETAAEYAIKIKQVLEFYEINPRGFEGAIISSVVPQVTGALLTAIALITGVKAMVVGPGIKTGMNIRLDDPSTLAGDLVAGSVAAIAYYGAPAIIIDMGTATTMVVVDKNKAYLGGAIIPGVKLAYGALASGTSLLPDIAIRLPKKVIASNTVDSMSSGAIYGTASMIDGMIDKMEAELGEKCTLVATGGLAKRIVECCQHEIIFDDDLLLKGLWVLYQKNK
jgi:type III pantothenate kinase